MSIVLTHRKGALLGLLAHLFILLTGQLIFILILFPHDFGIGVDMLVALQGNVYALTFYALLLIGGWILGGKVGARLAMGGSVVRTGLRSGLLVALLSVLFWMPVTISQSGLGTGLQVMRDPAILALVVFCINWLIVAVLSRTKAI
ncbi:hypothetical protein SAMN05444266_10967 [Chitinophaga jiangningensis]|uniref:Transmembrane protein n=1 Tax=Chitinophaga jiangningensis TaxID=1419482 RepID=A0A1M7JY56_9BACT|nr:hypothetical protein [Chitinophaga jiangningensis]SHM57914.1 hypothetical protein SAMN05444266_10967 [Chitinophaga jiangningensis]